MKPVTYILAASIVLASCGGNTDKDQQQLDKLKKERTELDKKIAALEAKHPDTTREVTSVSIMTVTATDFVANVEVQAEVLGDENVYATPQQPGSVTAVLVKSGQRVSKGQVLATIDAAALDQQIKGQDAQVQLFKSLYEKQQRLWAQNIGSEVQLMQAKTQYEANLKQKEALVAQRNMFRIVAPISGVVDQVDAKIGQPSGTAANNGGGIRIVNNEKLKAEASLGENYLGKIKTGDKVTILFPDVNDSIVSSLNYVAQAVDPLSRAFKVQVALRPDKRFHPNMSCKMKISNYENKNALVVPVSVIQKTAQGEMLYVINGSIAKTVIVQTGKISNGYVEILGGLKEGDKVVTEGFSDLDNGETVRIQ